MRLVIDIPYSVYEGICSPNTFSSDFNLAKAIENGEVLPADCGRLIDMDAILKKYWNHPTGIGRKQIESMPIIVKATKDVEKGCWNCQNYVSSHCKVCGKDTEYWSLRENKNGSKNRND